MRSFLQTTFDVPKVKKTIKPQQPAPVVQQPEIKVLRTDCEKCPKRRESLGEMQAQIKELLATKHEQTTLTRENKVTDRSATVLTLTI